MNNEQQIEILLPFLTNYIADITKRLSTSKKIDYSNAKWQFIISKEKSGPLLKHHILVEAWDGFKGFLSKKSNFYGFIEEKVKGLTEKDHIIWIFASPTIANEHFKFQLKIPESFNQKSIFQLPFPALALFLLKTVRKIILDSESGNAHRIQETLRILTLIDRLLGEKEIKQIDRAVVETGLDFINQEVAQLTEDHQQSSKDEGSLEKRSENIFHITLRLLKITDAMDSEYLNKLLAKEPEERMKGLQLSKKKLLDLSMQV